MCGVTRSPALYKTMLSLLFRQFPVKPLLDIMSLKGLLVTISCLAAVRFAASHSVGAPKDACVSMEPLHPRNTTLESDSKTTDGIYQPQEKEFPYLIKTSAKEIKQNQKLTITITASEVDKTQYFIKGFMVQARQTGSDIPVGQFLPREDVSLMKCTNPQDTVTHPSAKERTEVVLEWMPTEKIEGEVNFYFTIVHRLDIFWVRHPFGPINVKKN